jgi:hypothetical protein
MENFKDVWVLPPRKRTMKGKEYAATQVPVGKGVDTFRSRCLIALYLHEAGSKATAPKLGVVAQNS